MHFEELRSGVRVSGLIAGEPATLIAVQMHGGAAAEVTFKSASGAVAQQVLYADDVARLAPARVAGRPFDADAHEYRLAAETQRISLAGLFDPMLAVATSDVRPLPHQIRAVYGPLLDGKPLRFLLADDPGAGKTIMAGLYIKELVLRDDVKRCLIVAPGGLVEQWQDELFFKFGLRFELLTVQSVEQALDRSAFDRHPLLIARMDQLARNDELVAALGDSEWDLVVVDEAHRMGAYYFGNKLNKTRRFQLGEVLRDVTRHLLLMTATPHSGKEEDFQLLLTLLDRDRFEGRFRAGISSADTAGLMRRMVKEDLLTFEGKPLFPERVAQTVPYELTEAERHLYEQVTTYVREGMNRAQRLDKKRRNTVGFALTVLQRRLASSPEAIYQSLVRRSNRLSRHRKDILDGRLATPDIADYDVDDWDDPDEHSAEETERVEEELLDAATAARTVQELEVELRELDVLIEVASRVRSLDTDRKWSELRAIVEDNDLIAGSDGNPRKLIVFTEHRDTLEYLVRKVRSLLGRPAAVEAIHGGVPRRRRREITEEFTKSPDCQILLATDAAGEGLNLQAAHLMVNYDLPWNPNRIEQRFGRIHRIGQEEVCRLWNLVASDTREGEVFTRLLDKIEEQRKAYGGKIFDVLGAAFDETPLRDLLIEAIRYGDQPEVRARMHRVIDAGVADGLREVLEERALAHDHLTDDQLTALRRQMEEARARRLQPHYIEWAFRHAFARLGGRMAKRERDRFEISNVPARLRSRAGAGPIATRYDRVTFDLGAVQPGNGSRADLLAPGHPLHDAVTRETLGELATTLERGTVLVSPTLESPHLLVGVIEEIVDGTGQSVARRFGYAYVDQSGAVMAAGPAPYLDCVAAPQGAAVDAATALPWLDEAERVAQSWIIAHRLPEYLEEVRPRRSASIARTRAQVTERLNQEMNRLAGEAMVAEEQEATAAAGGSGRKRRTRESAESLSRKAADLEARLAHRLDLLDRQAQFSTRPPRVVTAALVLPLSMVEPALPPDAPIRAVETKEVERRGVDLVLASERSLGRVPEEMPYANPGYDVLSRSAGGQDLRIEVKARLTGAEDFHVTHNEVVTGKNAAPHYRLALVSVDPRGPEHDQVRYLADPFRGFEAGALEATGHRADWARTWAAGSPPF